MRDIRIATAQFENRDGDKAYSLSRILGVAGIALGTSLMYVVATFILAVMARRTLRRAEGASPVG